MTWLVVAAECHLLTLHEQTMTCITFWLTCLIIIVSTHLTGYTERIIRGEPAQDYPFYALVMNDDQKCGGTVVASNVILSRYS